MSCEKEKIRVTAEFKLREISSGPAELFPKIVKLRTHSKFISSVEAVTLEVIKKNKYIVTQKGKGNGK